MDWFRFHHKTLYAIKVQVLPIETRWRWVECLCLASENVSRGYLPPVRQIAFAMRVSELEAQAAVDALIAAGLIDVEEPGKYWMHDWEEYQKKSDNSAAYKAAQRAPKTKKGRRKKVSKDSPGNGQGHDEDTVGQNGVQIVSKDMSKGCPPTEREELSVLLVDNPRDAHGENEDECTTGDCLQSCVELAAELLGDPIANAISKAGVQAGTQISNRWDCMAAAIKTTSAQISGPKPPRIVNAWSYLRTIASDYVVMGIPPDPVPIHPKVFRPKPKANEEFYVADALDREFYGNTGTLP